MVMTASFTIILYSVSLLFAWLCPRCFKCCCLFNRQITPWCWSEETKLSRVAGHSWVPELLGKMPYIQKASVKSPNLTYFRAMSFHCPHLPPEGASWLLSLTVGIALLVLGFFCFLAKLCERRVEELFTQASVMYLCKWASRIHPSTLPYDRTTCILFYWSFPVQVGNRSWNVIAIKCKLWVISKTLFLQIDDNMLGLSRSSLGLNSLYQPHTFPVLGMVLQEHRLTVEAINLLFAVWELKGGCSLFGKGI